MDICVPKSISFEQILGKDIDGRDIRLVCKSVLVRERKMENMFALFTPICLCGSALTSTWARREAEYAKQLEQRLITLERLCKNMFHFLEFDVI